MNIKLKRCIYSLCNSIKEKNHIIGLFATNLGEKNIVLLNFLVDDDDKIKDLENEVHSKEKNQITYICHLFYFDKKDYQQIDYNNLTDSQIHFLELLTLSDIFIDKTGILHYLKNHFNQEYKNQSSKIKI